MVKHISAAVDDEVYNELHQMKGKQSWADFFEKLAENGIKGGEKQ